ncbi:DUF3021 domain-containing protein [Ruminococcus sp.]|uniref:DUF3021 domain-containing protein n=1 Tax=Ruminococcus sp. TaxID=41978 RepID=UPI003890CA38
MKKKVMLRCLIGAPIGLSISFMITLLISIIINKGEYYPVVPQLTALCGNELNAVILQTICSLIYGAAFGGASVIWEQENWSLLKQTVLHCLVISVSSFPIAYFMYWMPHSALGIAGYIALFFIIYFFIWFGWYFAMKKRIRELNERIKVNSVNG